MYSDRSCEVPECNGGWVRVPVIYEVTSYGFREKRVRFQEIECGECSP